jgi:hypothetical protein
MAELVDRTRQAVSKALERRGVGNTSEPAGSALEALVDPAALAGGPVIRGPFFASVRNREATVESIERLDPQFEQLRSRADRIVAGSYDLLGYSGLSFGSPPDSWLDPVAGVRAPAKHWSEIDYLNPAVAGDHKVIWELSRHQGLLALAQASWCTRDDKYLDTLASLLAHWLDSNPPKRGVNWASSLEVSFRSITWLWILALEGERLPRELTNRMTGFLALSAGHIQTYLSTWFSPNTHLTGEALGLFLLGTALPQCRGADKWRSRGSSILLEWLGRHVRADGTYVEQSTWYHRYTTDFYLYFLAIVDQSGLQQVRNRLREPLTGLLDYLRWVARPDGSLPLIGDDDGGRLCFLDERTGHDIRTPLALGAVLLESSELAHAGVASPELVWLLGPDAVHRLEQLQGPPPATTAKVFPEGGTCVIRTGWDNAASVMIIDAGPHGFLNGGHAHADALAIDFSLNGRPVFVDPGTFTYTTSSEWRDAFRETASHCAATVDGCGSAVTAGTFRWASRAEGRCLAWRDAESVVLFAGTHDGFSRLQPSVRYSRVVAYVKPDLWIVRDELDAGEEHELAVHWQCAPGIDAAEVEGGVALTRGHELVTVVGVAEPGEWKIGEGWVSPTYGARVPSNHLRYVRRGSGVLAITTCMTSSGQPLNLSLDPSALANSPVGIEWGSRRGVLATAGMSSDWLEPDAEVTWIELGPDDSAVKISASRGQPVTMATGIRENDAMVPSTSR